MFSNDIKEAIKQASKETGVEESTLKAFAEIESAGNINAVSQTGVKGLFQITKATWEGITDLPYSTNPKQQAIVAAKLIKGLEKQFAGRPDLVAYAYNAGPKVAEKALEYETRGISKDKAIAQATYDVYQNKDKVNETANYYNRFKAAKEGKKYEVIDYSSKVKERISEANKTNFKSGDFLLNMGSNHDGIDLLAKSLSLLPSDSIKLKKLFGLKVEKGFF